MNGMPILIHGLLKEEMAFVRAIDDEFDDIIGKCDREVDMAIQVALKQMGEDQKRQNTEEAKRIEKEESERAAVEEERRIAEEARVAEVEQRRMAKDEATRIEEEDMRRRAEEEETNRIAQEKIKRVAAEKEERRVASEKEERRVAAEKEECRVAAEKEERRVAAEKEEGRVAAEKEEMTGEQVRQDSEELARQIVSNEASRRAEEKQRHPDPPKLSRVRPESVESFSDFGNVDRMMMSIKTVAKNNRGRKKKVLADANVFSPIVTRTRSRRPAPVALSPVKKPRATRGHGKRKAPEEADADVPIQPPGRRRGAALEESDDAMVLSSIDDAAPEIVPEPAPVVAAAVLPGLVESVECDVNATHASASDPMQVVIELDPTAALMAQSGPIPSSPRSRRGRCPIQRVISPAIVEDNAEPVEMAAVAVPVRKRCVHDVPDNEADTSANHQDGGAPANMSQVDVVKDSGDCTDDDDMTIRPASKRKGLRRRGHAQHTGEFDADTSGDDPHDGDLTIRPATKLKELRRRANDQHTGDNDADASADDTDDDDRTIRPAAKRKGLPRRANAQHTDDKDADACPVVSTASKRLVPRRAAKAAACPPIVALAVKRRTRNASTAKDGCDDVDEDISLCGDADAPASDLRLSISTRDESSSAALTRDSPAAISVCSSDDDDDRPIIRKAGAGVPAMSRTTSDPAPLAEHSAMLISPASVIPGCRLPGLDVTLTVDSPPRLFVSSNVAPEPLLSSMSLEEDEEDGFEEVPADTSPSSPAPMPATLSSPGAPSQINGEIEYDEFPLCDVDTMLDCAAPIRTTVSTISPTQQSHTAPPIDFDDDELDANADNEALPDFAAVAAAALRSVGPRDKIVDDHQPKMIEILVDQSTPLPYHKFVAPVDRSVPVRVALPLPKARSHVLSKLLEDGDVEMLADDAPASKCESPQVEPERELSGSFASAKSTSDCVGSSSLSKTPHAPKKTNIGGPGSGGRDTTPNLTTLLEKNRSGSGARVAATPIVAAPVSSTAPIKRFGETTPRSESPVLSVSPSPELLFGVAAAASLAPSASALPAMPFAVAATPAIALSSSIIQSLSPFASPVDPTSTSSSLPADTTALAPTYKSSVSSESLNLRCLDSTALPAGDASRGLSSSSSLSSGEDPQSDPSSTLPSSDEPQSEPDRAKARSLWDALKSNVTTITSTVSSFVRPKEPEVKTKRTVDVKALKIAEKKKEKDNKRDAELREKSKKYMELSETRKRKAEEARTVREAETQKRDAIQRPPAPAAKYTPSAIVELVAAAPSSVAAAEVKLTTDQRLERAQERRQALEAEDKRKREEKIRQREDFQQRQRNEDAAKKVKSVKQAEEVKRSVEVAPQEDIESKMPKKLIGSVVAPSAIVRPAHKFAVPMSPAAPGKARVARAPAPVRADEPIIEIPEEPCKSDSDCDSDEDERRKAAVKVPSWAQQNALNISLERQSVLDPDRIFNTDYLKTCDLSDIFAAFATKTRFTRRTSSGNWMQDRLGWVEELEYKRRNGYLE